MSFSYTVKDELCLLLTDRDKKYACLYGMLLFSNKFELNKITFKTGQDNVASLFCQLVDDVLCQQNVVLVKKIEKGNGFSYTLDINSANFCGKIMQLYRISKENQYRRINMSNIDTNSLDMFLVGAFLAGGSITDPNKNYHMEVATPYFNLCKDLQDVLSMLAITAKYTERKGVQVIYIKESENIEDILTFMGAINSSLEIMNVKILKDVRNKANRLSNCDNANIEKTVIASINQVNDIEIIIKNKGLGILSDELRDLAEVRLENPEVSLFELSKMLKKPITKAGVYHRMKKLAEIANKIKLEGA